MRSARIVPKQLNMEVGKDFRKLATFDSGQQRFGSEFPKLWKVDIRHAGYFAGRQETMAKMKPFLTEEHRPIALTGISGIGKTRAAVEYAYAQRGSYLKDGVLLLQAHSEQELAEQFKEATKSTDSIQQWLDTHPESLVILDNIDGELAKQFSSSKNHLLLTSTSEIAGVENMPLDGIEDKEGALLLLKRAGRIGATGKLTDVASALQQSALTFSQVLHGNPAHLEAAGRYINETESAVNAVLGYAQQGRFKLKETRESSGILSMEYVPA